MSILCLSWINQELRKEIERQEQAQALARHSIFGSYLTTMVSRTTAFLIVGFTACWGLMARFMAT